MSAKRKLANELEHKIDRVHQGSPVIHAADDDEFLQISSEISLLAVALGGTCLVPRA